MKPICAICGEEFEEAGGLLFEPPETVRETVEVGKFHICSNCWREKISPLVE